MDDDKGYSREECLQMYDGNRADIQRINNKINRLRKSINCWDSLFFMNCARKASKMFWRFQDFSEKKMTLFQKL